MGLQIPPEAIMATGPHGFPSDTSYVDTDQEAVFAPKSILICLGLNPALAFPGWTFAGTILSTFPTMHPGPDAHVYATGDMSFLPAAFIVATDAPPCPYPYTWVDTHLVTSLLPRVIPELGTAVLYPAGFPNHEHLFGTIMGSHTFHALTESNKPADTSLRRGVYITRVDKSTGMYKLLRCSTNLSGPTEDFAAVDEFIAHTVNGFVRANYDHAAEVDHVLAQVYHNHVTDNSKHRKARISAHSDKTKDMAPNGVMAFVTLYADLGVHGTTFGTKETSTLTGLVWRRKDDGTPSQKVEVLLPPGSVFIIPLSVNRAWTHETKPSSLPVDKIPTRMGYVMRCSNTWARFDPTLQTTVLEPEGLPLCPPTEKDLDLLRVLYFRENTSVHRVHYPRPVLFSMNRGDYLPPTLTPDMASASMTSTVHPTADPTGHPLVTGSSTAYVLGTERGP
jgi:hypothetical protein